MRAREFVAEITISGPDPRVKSYIDRMYAKFPRTWQNNHVMSWGKGDEQQLAIFELVPSLSRGVQRKSNGFKYIHCVVG